MSAAVPGQDPAAAAQPARRSGPDAPSVLVEPGAHAAAGARATMTVHVRNVSAAPQDVTVALVGLEPAWLPPAATAPAVPPDATVTVELPVVPAVGAVPGDYPCLLVVEAAPGARAVLDAAVRVDGPSELVVSVEPADVHGVRRRRVDVVVANTGAHPASVDLAGTADDRLDVRLGARTVDVRPAETVRVPATVRARRVRVVGGRERHTFAVTATGRAAPQRTQGTFTTRAVLGGGALRATAMVTVLALWAVGALVALPRVAERFGAEDSAVVAEQDAPGAGQDGSGADGTEQDGGGSGAQDGGGSGAQDGGGSGAQDGGDPADGAPQAVRVSGVVTGAEPDGVTIRVVPTSDLWPAPVVGDDPAGDEVGTVQAAASGVVRAAAAVAAGPLGALAALAGDLLRTDGTVHAVVGALRAAGPGRPAAPGKTPASALRVERVAGVQRLTTTTDTSGVWALAGLAPSARYLVTVSKPGFATQRVVMTGAELAATPLATELTAGDGSISGTVRGPDGPAGGVEITLSDGTTTVTTRSATEGDVGRWRVDGLSTPSTYLVTASSEDLGAQSRLVPLGAGGAAEVDLVLEAGVATISGRVVGTDSLGGVGGLGGLTVTATDGTTTRTATTVTGARAGTFVLPELPAPGSYTVTVEGTGYATVTRRVDLTPAGVADWELSVNAVGGAVSGTVTDDAGTGLAAAGLVLTSQEATYKTMSSSDDSGTYRFAGVAPGVYVLSAESFGHETVHAEVTVRSGGTVDVPLVLARVPGGGLTASSSITGRVTDATTGGSLACPFLEPGEECAVTAVVTAQRPDGSTETVEATASPEDPYRLGAPAGDPAAEGLLPGRYVVTLTAPGYEPGRVTVTVPMGAEAQAATVALERSPSLVGSVQARTGVLPDGVCVVARAVGAAEPASPCDPEEPACSATTSRCVLVTEGRYQIDRLPAGEYLVDVVNLTGGYLSPPTKTVALVRGQERRYDVIVERQGILSVTALRSDGLGSVTDAAGSWVQAVDDEGHVVDEQQVGEGGFVQLTGLPPGRYTVVGRTDADGPVAARTTVAVGLNQEIALQLVLASPVDSVLARVEYQLTAGTTRPVEGAQLTVNGVVRYEGAVPQREERTFSTDAGGSVLLCTAAAPGCGAVLPLVEHVVDVRVTAPGFEAYSANGVALDELASIQLEPAAQRLDGQVTLVPGGDPAAVRFEVVEAPPGVGVVSLAAAADGTVTFVDSDLPTDGAVRPGRYTITARLDGYAAHTVRLDVPLRRDATVAEAVPARWELHQDGRVAVRPVDGPGGAAVAGTVVELRTPDGTVVTREAGPGQSVLDLGTLPAGDGYTVSVRAAGFDVTDRAFTVEPGATLANPTEVPLVRLGTVEGSVVSVLGRDWTQELPGATVTVAGDAASADPATFTGSTDQDGRFRVTGTRDTPGLRAGSWTVSATADGHTPFPAEDPGDPEADPWPPPSQVVGEVTAGAVTDVGMLGLQVRPGGLVVTVQDGGDAVAGLRMQLVYGDARRDVPPVSPCDASDADCQTGGGTYHFVDLLPLTYTLFVSGHGYLPLNLPVAVPAGETTSRVVAITTPAGSVQGTLAQVLPDGSTGPVTGDAYQVALLADDGAEVATASPGADGGYLLDDVPAGAYAVVVRQRVEGETDDADTWTEVLRRGVTVLPGQGVVLDLTLPAVLRQVRVTATSTHGADLTGALVTLTGTPAGSDVETTFGPQPLARAGAAFAATFAQVPPGTWRATVTGPAGHHGTYTGAELTVTASSPDVVATEVTVTATQVRLAAAVAAGSPTGSTPPGAVTVTLTPPDDEDETGGVSAELLLGASDTVLFLPAVGWDVDVTLGGAGTERWEATASAASVPAGAASRLVQVTVRHLPVGTTTTLTATPESLELGQGVDVDLEVSVAATEDADPAPEGGTVLVESRVDGGTWTTIASQAYAGSSLTLSVPSGRLAPGEHEFRATYTGMAPWQGSTGSDTVTVTLPEPPAPSPSPEPTTGEDDGTAP